MQNKQIEPVLKTTSIVTYVVEFYGEAGALGNCRISVSPDERNVMGIAFKQANPKCLAATSVKFFRQ